MIRKPKHPTDRGSRRAIGKKKEVHRSASPVFKLLKEREELGNYVAVTPAKQA